jgi:anti-anti-sigma regulatory factor
VRLSNVESSVVLQPVGKLIIAPLRGPITQDLLAELSSKILEYLHCSEALGVVIDMSGVELLDEHDLQDLRMVVQSAALMGAHVVLAGIRPGVAVGLTMLDVDDGWIHATRTVDIALESFA